MLNDRSFEIHNIYLQIICENAYLLPAKILRSMYLSKKHLFYSNYNDSRPLDIMMFIHSGLRVVILFTKRIVKSKIQTINSQVTH